MLEGVLFVGAVSEVAKHPEQDDAGEVAENDAADRRPEH